ncbi:MAG: AAA family ATPase, partial [Oscillospiraceae bacterium]|nr:AAA family ATPase [Oscillospiraceae bacterium]
MIPKKLRFKAFESYVEEQIIDFEKFDTGSLFLIHGETGAGKTAILDAVAYALYGETSGGGRDEVRSLHE